MVKKSILPCSDLPPSNQAVILHHGLSADQATTLLGRTIQLLEWGKQSSHKMPEANA
jgi:hypothetical protein